MSQGRRSFTDATVRRLRERYAEGATQVELADRLGVDRTTIQLLVRGKTYRNAGGPIAGRRKKANGAC